MAVAKRERKTINVYTDKRGAQQVLSELKTSILEQSVTEKPTSGLSDINKNRDYSSLKSPKPSEKSKRNVFGSYNNVSSVLGVGFSSFPVLVAKDVLGNTTLDSGPVVGVFETVFELCQPPDPLTEKPVQSQQEELEAGFFGITALVNNLLEPVTKLGVVDANVSLIPTNVPDIETLQLNSVERLTQKTIKLSRGKIQGLDKQITLQEFKKIPNHYKNLLRATTTSLTGPGSNLFSTSIEQAGLARAEITFTYDMITRVSFLTGYNKKEDGTLIMSEPIWEDLTEEKYNELSGKTILCKMKPYTNAALGIKPSKGMRTKIYDETFFLVPKSQASLNTLQTYSLVLSDDKKKTMPIRTNLVTNMRTAEKQIMNVAVEATSNYKASNITISEMIGKLKNKTTDAPARTSTTQNITATQIDSVTQREAVSFDLAFRTGSSISSGQSETAKPSSAETILRTKNKTSK